jgi:tRNA pseudouridine13 synthase
VERHTNKIKLGHLAGNRFEIRIREVGAEALPAAQAIMAVLQQRGVPNYFGAQRFGARGDNARIGAAILGDDFAAAMSWLLGRPGPPDRDDIARARQLFEAGDYAAAAEAWPQSMRMQVRLCRLLARDGADFRKAWRAVDHTMRKLYLSAVQSELFNRVLALRIGEMDRLETGDLAFKHANGACFRVWDAAVEQPRSDAFEISPTGPLFGRRMTEPTGQPGQREAKVLAASGLAAGQFRAREGVRLDGARRALRVPVSDAALQPGSDDRGPYLQISFILPAGAYATNVTRELCKTDEPEAAF